VTARSSGPPGQDDRRPPARDADPSLQQATASDTANNTHLGRLTWCPCGCVRDYECITRTPLRLIRDDDGWRGVYYLDDEGGLRMRLLRDDLAVAS